VLNRAYAAVVYLRVIHSISNFQVNLICAKTKVAPIKTISISRLELNAVVLLSGLLFWTRRALLVERSDIWMDGFHHHISMVKTISLQMENVCCKPSLQGSNFVIRRWQHVSSKENPDNYTSRGLSASMLFSYDLWNDPPWLKSASITWPKRDPTMPNAR